MKTCEECGASGDEIPPILTDENEKVLARSLDSPDAGVAKEAALKLYGDGRETCPYCGAYIE